MNNRRNLLELNKVGLASGSILMNAPQPHSCLGAVVLSLNSSAAFTTMKAVLVIRS